MPEFVLEGRDHAARAESDFVLGYIEALFFTESASGIYMADWADPENQNDIAEGLADGCLPSDAGYSDLHESTLEVIRADCEAFQSKAADLLALAYAHDYDEAQAGRDFWYTRNGHGVGFWDREELEADSEEYERLTETMRETYGRDDTAWQAALDKRNALNAGALGESLSAIAREFGEPWIHFADHVEHGAASYVYCE